MYPLSEFNKNALPMSPILFYVLTTFFLLQFSLKTAGVYKATISDERGKDMSQIDISGQGKHTVFFFTNLISMIN